MSTIAVVQAEAALAIARAEQAKQERENATREIKRLTTEGVKLRAALHKLIKQVNNAQTDRLILHSELQKAREQIGIYSEQLDPLTFPTPEDEAKRVMQLGLWQERQVELQRLHKEACRRESVRVQAAEMQQQLLNMQYEIRNLMAIAQGRRPGQLPQGGLSRVG